MSLVVIWCIVIWGGLSLKRPFMVLTLRPHKVNGISVRVVNWNSMRNPSATPSVCVCVSGPHVSLSHRHCIFWKVLSGTYLQLWERDGEKMKREGREGARALRKQVNRLAFFSEPLFCLSIGLWLSGLKRMNYSSEHGLPALSGVSDDSSLITHSLPFM